MSAEPKIPILLVEDSPTDVLLAKEALGEGSRFEVTVAERLSQARQLLEQEQFSVVLLDLGLPDSQGLETLLGLRHADARIPVVVMTAKNDEDLAVRAVQEGAQDYLVKSQIQTGMLGRSIRYAVERRRGEEMLRSAHAMLQHLLAHSPAVIYTLKIEGTQLIPVLVSDNIERLLGVTGKEATYDWWAASLHPQDRDRAITTVARGMAEGGYSVEYRIRHKDGTYRWVEDNNRVVRDAAGRPQLAVGVWTDTTERHRLAAERDALLARLQLQIMRMPLAYVLFDSEFRIIDWNPAAERLFGYAREEAMGKVPFDLVPESFRDAGEEILRRIRAGEMTAHSTNENVTKDGRTITCQWLNTPLLAEDGSFVGLLCLAQDVTAQKSLEEQLRQAQKMEAIGQLAGGVAHDFNNLLTIINGYSEVLMANLNAADPMRGGLELIKKSGERAAALTRQLLAFSRKQILQPVVLNLNAIITDMDKMLRRLIGEDIDLRTTLEPQPWLVKADPGQVEQVVMNLVVNARDAMPQGGKLILETRNVRLDDRYAVTHRYVRPGEYVLLAVSDTGHGMDKATQARIFEPFFTTKGPHKGTGLGLSTVYGIFKQSEGSIEVYSEPGHGTSFKIYLPRSEAVTPLRKSDPGRHAPARGSETILVVEDDAGVRSLTRLILEQQGYTVLETANGGEALLRCEQHQGTIHLVVTDVVMPNMSGPQLVERLMQLRPGLKRMFVSGYTDEAVVHHGISSPDMPFLQKPYQPEALAKKVREVLDR